ncbi:3-oxoacyl-ACP synthase III family protein [Tessaracoccus flavescens]|uniref:3-oxoacyl-ACP synthase III family protein n=1 Tax=Tessaracoccus flavescens TaxID=399497 RepID=UPI000984312C|nr:hypothetical protein [Tessaracoccus flavescens]
MTVRGLQIDGYGVCLPEGTVTFGSATRYRAEAPAQHLDMLVDSAQKAIAAAGISADDLDCIIGATAGDVQPIPCTASLVQERVAPDARCAALDVNSTCTSFITALDVASRYLRDGEYRRILIVAGDVGAQFLHPGQRESFELFSDAAVAVVVSSPSAEGVGVLASLQQTWPRHAHETELRGGGSRMPGRDFHPDNDHDYRFDMDGRAVLLSASRVLPGFFERFFEKAGTSVDEIDYVIPHQASRALPLHATDRDPRGPLRELRRGLRQHGLRLGPVRPCEGLGRGPDRAWQPRAALRHGCWPHGERAAAAALTRQARASKNSTRDPVMAASASARSTVGTPSPSWGP